MDEDPADWSEGELSNVTCDREPSDWASDGAQVEDLYADPAAAGSSDERHSLSSDKDPSLWSFDGVMPSLDWKALVMLK